MNAVKNLIFRIVQNENTLLFPKNSIKQPGKSNNSHTRAFKFKTHLLMRLIDRLTISFISLFAIAACEGDNPYSSYRANIVFDGNIYPYNQARSFG